VLLVLSTVLPVWKAVRAEGSAGPATSKAEGAARAVGEGRGREGRGREGTVRRDD
jgi:hypothetical protein